MPRATREQNAALMMSAALLLAACACASAPDPAPPGAYTPPADVGSLDCDQVRAEFMRLSVHVAAIARPEAAKLRRYQIVLGNEPAVPWPAVIALRRYARARGRVRFSTRNVVARDHFTCQYCGLRPRLADGRPDREQLTTDHVVPRAQARDGVVYLPWSKQWVNVTSWENCCAACRACNCRKADHTPMQANMPLRQYPRVPTQADVLRLALARVGVVPEEWRIYLPEGWDLLADSGLNVPDLRQLSVS